MDLKLPQQVLIKLSKLEQIFQCPWNLWLIIFCPSLNWNPWTCTYSLRCPMTMHDLHNIQVIAAAKQGHYAVGYDLNLWLVLYSRWKALISGVHKRTEFHRKDLWKVKYFAYHCHRNIKLSTLIYVKVDLSDYSSIIIFGVDSMVRHV